MPEIAAHTGATRPLKALFTTAVWGKGYVDRFLNYSLRTQLSPGNLGAFDSGSQYLIITAAADIERVTASAAFAALSQMVSARCVALEDIRGSRSADKYAKLTACQNYALERSEDFEAIFFGYGDALWADGSYSAAMQRVQEGYDAIFSFGYPVFGHRFVRSLPQLGGDPQAPVAAIPSRTFARAVHEHLHPMALSTKWTNEVMARCPSYVTWDVPSQGMLLRAFHLHPVAVRVRPEDSQFFAPFRSTLDEEFVVRLYRTDPRVYVSSSSDEMCVCSLASETTDTYQRIPPRRRGVGALAEFAETHAGLLHRELFQRSIRLVTDDVSEDRWHAVEQEAAALSREVNQRLATPDSVLALELPAAYEARWKRRRDFHHISAITAQVDDKVAPLQPDDKVAPLQPDDKVAPLQPDDKVAPWQLLDDATALHWSPGMARRTLMHRSVKLLHALYITRAVRLLIFPFLNNRQRQWCYDFIRGISGDSQLIWWPRRYRRGSTEMGWWQWLWSWIRVHA